MVRFERVLPARELLADLLFELNQPAAALGGKINGIVGNQVTISFGDGSEAHTAILDISSASLFSGGHTATATPISSASAPSSSSRGSSARLSSPKTRSNSGVVR